MIRLYPNQELAVVLTDEYASCHIVERTDFLILDRVEHLRNGAAHIYRQKEDYTDWSAWSAVLLGEIGLDVGFQFSSLCVLLACTTNRGNLLTAISPCGQALKIEPQQTVQVVLPDDDQEWDWTAHQSQGWVIESAGITGYPAEKAQYHKSAERYYYFRYDRPSIENMQSLPHGIYPGGTLVFFKGSLECDLRLVVNIRARHKERAFSAPRFNNPYITPINKLRRSKPASGPFTSTVRITEKENSTIESDCRVQYTNCV